MARATRSNNKATAAITSPLAGRTRSKRKEKEAAAVTASSSSQPAADALPATDSAPITENAEAPIAETAEAPVAETAEASTTKTSNKASDKKKPQSKAKGTTRAAKGSASTKNNTTSEDSSDNTTNTRPRRQPPVDRNAKNKVTKPRARKAPTKNTSEAKKEAIEKHVEEQVATTPARPRRTTRSTLRNGMGSPLAPVTQNVDAIARNTRSKKVLKDATPLSIMPSHDDSHDNPNDDDWFKELRQEPRIYRDPGASMEELSEREETHDDIVDHDTATSDGDEAMGEDLEMVVDHTENDTVEHMEHDAAKHDVEDDASETEEDPVDDDDQHQAPKTPSQPHMDREAPTTARTYGISNLFFNPLASVRKLFGRATTPAPAASADLSPADQSIASLSPTSPTPGVTSPTIASPSSAAHERRTRNNNRDSSSRISSVRRSSTRRASNRSAPVTPRQKDADRRHSAAELQKSIAQLKHEELLAIERQIEELKHQKEQDEAQQVPGQKRRRASPDVIPARRPGDCSGSYGMLEEYFVDGDSSIIDSVQTSTKRRRTIIDDDDSDSDSDYDFAAQDRHTYTPPSSLKRPRNSARMAAMREGLEDPMVINHETRVMHQENSFSRSPLRDSPNMGNKNSPKNKKSSPSTIYNGSVMAMPGDSGYKPENVFKKSEEQIQLAKNIKMSSDELKACAEEIVRKQNDGEDVTAEELQLLDKAQRKFGHIKGSGSFSAPEYDSDDDSIISDDSEEDASADRTSPTASPASKPTGGETSSMQPPPAPTPAHAQLPAGKSTNEAPVPKTPAAAQNANLFQSAALARQRELAEKHKPKMGSRLQFVSEVSSSPVGAQSPEGRQNSLSESLITQGIENGVYLVYDALVESDPWLLNNLSEDERRMLESEPEEEKKARELKEFAKYDQMVADLSCS